MTAVPTPYHYWKYPGSHYPKDGAVYRKCEDCPCDQDAGLCCGPSVFGAPPPGPGDAGWVKSANAEYASNRLQFATAGSVLTISHDYSPTDNVIYTLCAEVEADDYDWVRLTFQNWQGEREASAWFNIRDGYIGGRTNEIDCHTIRPWYENDVTGNTVYKIEASATALGANAGSGAILSWENLEFGTSSVTGGVGEGNYLYEIDLSEYQDISCPCNYAQCRGWWCWEGPQAITVTFPQDIFRINDFEVTGGFPATNFDFQNEFCEIQNQVAFTPSGCLNLNQVAGQSWELDMLCKTTGADGPGQTIPGCSGFSPFQDSFSCVWAIDIPNITICGGSDGINGQPEVIAKHLWLTMLVTSINGVGYSYLTLRIGNYTDYTPFIYTLGAWTHFTTGPATRCPLDITGGLDGWFFQGQSYTAKWQNVIPWAPKANDENGLGFCMQGGAPDIEVTLDT